MLPLNNDQTEGKTRFEFIDSLRGIAILGVILVHAALASRQTGALLGLSYLGYRGVQLFYVVSAFTLFLSFERGKSERYRWSNFFIRRLFRIAPLFYVAALGNLVVYGRQGLSLLELVLCFTFLQGASPRAIDTVPAGGWSVAVESGFYVLFPLLFLYITTLKKSLTVFLVSAVSLGGTSFALASLPRFSEASTQIYFRLFWLPVELPVFILGITAYFLWKIRSKWRDSVDPFLILITSIFLSIAALPVKNWGLYLSCIPFIGLTVGLSVQPLPLLVNPFTRFIGKISYSIYLMHFFVLFAIDRLHFRMPPNAFGFALAYLLILAASIPLCVLTFKYIEEPGIRFGAAWIRKREAKAAVNSPYGLERPNPFGPDT